MPLHYEGLSLALDEMQKRRPPNDEWVEAPENELIAPLAATCFSRSLLTFDDNSATALDLKDEENNTIVEFLSSLHPGDQEQALPTMEPASKGESDEEEYKEEFENKGTSYCNVRCFDRQSITGAAPPKDPSLRHLARAKKSDHSGIQEIMSIATFTQTDHILDILARTHENFILC